MDGLQALPNNGEGKGGNTHGRAKAQVRALPIEPRGHLVDAAKHASRPSPAWASRATARPSSTSPRSLTFRRQVDAYFKAAALAINAKHLPARRSREAPCVDELTRALERRRRKLFRGPMPNRGGTGHVLIVARVAVEQVERAAVHGLLATRARVVQDGLILNGVIATRLVSLRVANGGVRPDPRRRRRRCRARLR